MDYREVIVSPRYSRALYYKARFICYKNDELIVLLAAKKIIDYLLPHAVIGLR